MRCVRDNVNNRWNRNAKKEKKNKNKIKQKKEKKRQKITRGTETIAKGWELSDFVVHLS